MYVACPSCKSLYQIEPAHLRAAAGKLHCGTCQQTFNATSAVFDEPRQALDYARQHPSSDAVVREIDELVNMALDQVSGGAVAQAGAGQRLDGYGLATAEDVVAPELPVADPAETPAATVAGDSLPGGTPARAKEAVAWDLDALVEEIVIESGQAAEVREHRADVDCYAHPVGSEFLPRRQAQFTPEPELSPDLLFESDGRGGISRGTWGAIAATVLLSAILLGQYAWVERYRLAGIPAWRPALDLVCGQLGCDLPLRRDLASVEIVKRDVRDHPHVDDALLINAGFVNRADFEQAYPVLQVTFSDVSGSLVAVRRFQPAEYLSGQQPPAGGMRPGEQAVLMLEVVDPGERAVSFQFEFL